MKPSPYAWLVVALLWVVACLNYLDRQVIFSVFPLIRAEMKLDDVQLGLLGTMFLWIYGFASPFGGYLADRVGRKRVVVLSLAIWTTVTLLTGYVQDFPQLLVARALMGLSEACYLPAALALISELHPGGTRSLATGLHQSGLYVGIAFGGGVGGWMGETHGWRAPFVVLGAIGLVYAIIIAKGIRSEAPVARSAAQPEMMASFRNVCGLPGFAGMLIAFAGFSAANWLVATWLPLYLYERFNLSLSSAGFSATFYLQAAAFVGIIGGGWLSDRWSKSNSRARVYAQALGMGIAAPFLFLLGAAASIPMAVAALIVFGIGKGLYDCNNMPVLAQVAAPEIRATGYGILNLAGCVVGGTMAALGGVLKPMIGLSGAIQLSAVLVVLSALSLYQVASVLKRPTMAASNAAR